VLQARADLRDALLQRLLPLFLRRGAPAVAAVRLGRLRRRLLRRLLLRPLLRLLRPRVLSLPRPLAQVAAAGVGRGGGCCKDAVALAVAACRRPNRCRLLLPVVARRLPAAALSLIMLAAAAGGRRPRGAAAASPVPVVPGI
jgi:hypothetical protein